MPTHTDAKFPLWEPRNNMILAWILNYVNTNIAESIIDVWNDLYDSCGGIKLLVEREEKERERQADVVTKSDNDGSHASYQSTATKTTNWATTSGFEALHSLRYG
ncbi:hypothetical protein JRO89_XS04G0192900 [Xanthoceras sorbifolium]|uniref:Uncharacterized protein n=1 Tax=Xanthoceras sorbifolium TaxID=99658 RepID=A0ABQ8I659_9ROSI|nr:hypothetical protein JRO89_XS04G0192900 [Xanthoceras sorbifolium]